MRDLRKPATIIVESTIEVPGMIADDYARRLQAAGQAIVRIEYADRPDNVLLEQDFRDYARASGVRKNVATKIWRTGQYICERVLSKSKEHEKPMLSFSKTELNLDSIIGFMRSIEAGDEERGCGIGKSSWNLYAHIIADQFESPGRTRLILPWMEDIHPRLFMATFADRTAAVSELERRYQAYEQI